MEIVETREIPKPKIKRFITPEDNQCYILGVPFDTSPADVLSALKAT